MGNSKSAHHRRHMALADKYRNPNRLIHALLVGDELSGKTGLIMRYLANSNPTIDQDYFTFFDKVCYSIIARQQLYNVNLYNVPETINPAILRAQIFQEPDVIILCFSLINPTTMENVVNKWHPEIKRDSPRSPIILVGIFSDIRDDIEHSSEEHFDSNGEKLVPISFTEGGALGQRLGVVAYIECSLANGLGVEQIFYEAARVTGKRIPLEIGVRDKTVAHRDSVALKRYDFHHENLYSHKLFLEY